MSAGSEPRRGRRVFLALDPPAEVRAEAEAWARHIARSRAGLRVVPARNSHITLAFLGDRERSEIEAIADVAAEAANPVDRTGPIGGLSLGAPAWLPKRRPRSLVLDIHDDRDELVELQHRIAQGLNDLLGFKEGRPYRPHLTCARTGRGFDPLGLRLPVSPSMAFEAESVTLYASHLSPEGAEYEVIERFVQ